MIIRLPRRTVLYGVCYMNSFGSWPGPEAGSFEHVNELSGSIKRLGNS
jgi:hypothetical protein